MPVLTWFLIFLYAYLCIPVYLSVCLSIHQHQSFPFFCAFCFPKPKSAPLLCPGICSLFPPCVSLSCLLSKDFQLHNFQSQGRPLGANGMGNNIKITFFFVALNVKEKSFDRKNYKALENKVNHCGRMPEVDKWKDGNVSITSAICFLCCEFFFRPHCSSPPSSTLFSLSHPSPQPVPQSPLYFSLIHFPFLFFYIWSFFSSHLLCSLSKILFVRCQRSGRARLWAERTCHNREHKTEEIDLTFISAVQWRLRKLLEDCRAVYDAQ